MPSRASASGKAFTAFRLPHFLKPVTLMAQSQGSVNRRAIMDWLGIVPFMLFALLFLIIPTLYLVSGAFFTEGGQLTGKNFVDLFSATIVAAYWISIKISLASGIGGLLFGFFLAWAITMGGLPRWVRSFFLTFSGVASNFAGIPLAFAFLATIGPNGMITHLLMNEFGYRLPAHFNILSFYGLTLTYMYFQIPLMVLIITPALDGLKKEWHEAASILGADTWQYWRMVVLPVLWPSLMGTFLLLFANSFGAIATAIALTGSSLNIVPMVLYAQIRGDVLHNANLGHAVALGMVVITGVSNFLYIWLRIRAERWQK
jgi:putative spermidine/putrescine transport system permease protein